MQYGKKVSDLCTSWENAIVVEVSDLCTSCENAIVLFIKIIQVRRNDFVFPVTVHVNL